MSTTIQKIKKLKIICPMGLRCYLFLLVIYVFTLFIIQTKILNEILK